MRKMLEVVPGGFLVLVNGDMLEALEVRVRVVRIAAIDVAFGFLLMACWELLS